MRNGLVYKVEHFSDALEEIKQLVPQHGKEAEVKDLNVDYGRFLEINAMGNLLLLTARHCGVLVGYIVSIANIDIHRRHVKQISIQDYYVVEEYRKSGVAIRMFKELEQLIEKSDIREMHVDSKLKYDKLFQLLGWIETGHIYSKRVKCVIQ